MVIVTAKMDPFQIRLVNRFTTAMKITTIRFNTFFLFVSLFLFFLSSCDAENSDSHNNLFPSKTVYFGVNMGGGSTEWKYLVDTIDPSDSSTEGFTPVSVSEGGPSWGVVFGYDVSKNFAIELQYMQFADANISFGPDTAYVYPGTTTPLIDMISKTDAYSLSGKFFVPVGGVNTHLRSFAAIGVGTVERYDVLQNSSCVTPYVSAGLDYNFTAHWIVESGFQYYTGFGASQELPADSFIPFAWDAYGRLAYQL